MRAPDDAAMDTVPRTEGPRLETSLALTRAWEDPEDLVDLGDGHAGLGLVGSHDQVGGEFDLIEQLVVFEAHIERIHASSPSLFPLDACCQFLTRLQGRETNMRTAETHILPYFAETEGASTVSRSKPLCCVTRIR